MKQLNDFNLGTEKWSGIWGDVCGQLSGSAYTFCQKDLFLVFVEQFEFARDIEKNEFEARR